MVRELSGVGLRLPWFAVPHHGHVIVWSRPDLSSAAFVFECYWLSRIAIPGAEMRSARLQGLTLQPAGERLIVSREKAFFFFLFSLHAPTTTWKSANSPRTTRTNIGWSEMVVVQQVD